MVVNLYGETILCINEVCDIVEKRAMRNGFFELNFSLNSEKQGFWLQPRSAFSVHDTPGIYSIFKDKHLEYIGQGASIGGRLSRFVKGVLMKNRYDEGFSAADKWATWHGRKLDNCYVMFAEYYDFDQKEYGYSRETIENHLIMRHNPRMNVK